MVACCGASSCGAGRQSSQLFSGRCLPPWTRGLGVQTLLVHASHFVEALQTMQLRPPFQSPLQRGPCLQLSRVGGGCLLWERSWKHCIRLTCGACASAPDVGWCDALPMLRRQRRQNFRGGLPMDDSPLLLLCRRLFPMGLGPAWSILVCVTTTSKTCCSDRTPRCAIPNTHAGPGARVSLRVFARAQSTHTGPPGCKPCGSSSARRVPSHAWTQEQAEHPFPRCNTCPCASTRCWVAADGASQPPSPLLPRPRPGCRRATFTPSLWGG